MGKIIDYLIVIGLLVLTVILYMMPMWAYHKYKKRKPKEKDISRYTATITDMTYYQSVAITKYGERYTYTYDVTFAFNHTTRTFSVPSFLYSSLKIGDTGILSYTKHGEILGFGDKYKEFINVDPEL
ncbi:MULTISPECIES: hypothetical protein [unclassified Breznakia]|uniref:hypothetical protein n=1 Tax=unclassified Breznakia TaxID=2623764 RepID=UPI00247378FF|nr:MULTISPECIES: hypothetical protein [unclassified Breznakia]MDH6366170.1 hypothetical protein [Breznakia sp. PH1-1]MDH6403263.1 hypothetical protein [Breznakia sp. PF1-11]MDH6410972.1 hypothetical protein [Breznakia sp. PFB1-11]MDH6413336.1 hypothetical protein [Breznakia sp. PFB1-14]MDH6416101.1 hypothetical protein [Breznakia sp. PFB1-4]